MASKNCPGKIRGGQYTISAEERAVSFFGANATCLVLLAELLLLLLGKLLLLLLVGLLMLLAGLSLPLVWLMLLQLLAELLLLLLVELLWLGLLLSFSPFRPSSCIFSVLASER